MLAGIPLPAEQALNQPDKFFLPIAGTVTREPIGFAVRKGDVDTLNFFDSWIRVMEAEGWLTERKRYWFDTHEWKALLK
jgi:polar amino acid transport system substrate-binding protein